MIYTYAYDILGHPGTVLGSPRHTSFEGAIADIYPPELNITEYPTATSYFDNMPQFTINDDLMCLLHVYVLERPN